MSYEKITAPVPSDKMPAGIPYIVGNEAAERFSFYGMRTILTVYMTKHLVDAAGAPDVMSDEEAKFYFHLFVMSAYFFPIAGALLSDWFLGKYRTILSLSIVYCLGHFFLALGDSGLGSLAGLAPRLFLFGGLIFIAIGSGGIKPCVSAHVGDQFGKRNEHLLGRVFNWFYFAINLGSCLSTLLTPLLLEWFGPSIAFGVPGVLMFLATVVFWIGRTKFVHIPAGGLGFLKESFSGEGIRVILKLSVIYVFVAMFWALFDQTGSAWVLQADNMNLNFLWIEWLPSQIQAMNPFLILLFIPLFSYVVYPAIDRVFPLTTLRKVSIGLFVAVVSFAICAWMEMRIQGGATPSIGWQFLAYAVLTAAEVMISITCLEFSYTQAPKRMKSIIMALYLLAVSAGNAFTAAVNYFIQNEDGSTKLEGAAYYWFFTALMLGTAIVFVPVAKLYRGRTYIQGDKD
jgi:POT family proton-dependent oligopeptide transporter